MSSPGRSSGSSPASGNLSQAAQAAAQAASQALMAQAAQAIASSGSSASTNGGNPSKDMQSSNSSDGEASAAATFKMMLLAAMVLQNSSTVLVGRYTRAGVPSDQLYEVNHLIVVIEICKLLLAAALEFYSTNGQLVQSINMHVVKNSVDTLKMLVPALLYLVQNTLLYVALSNLTAPIFQVTYQAKLVTTALVSVLMLGRQYVMQQWICLTGLSLGVAVVVLGEKTGSKAQDNKDTHQNLVLGLTAVSIACLSSALAGVYFEKVLKKPTSVSSGDDKKIPPASLWMRNMQLAFFSVVIAILQGGGSSVDTSKPYLHGFSFWAWVLVALQAGGGMLVAAVIKYADNVLKGLATGVSVVLATALSMVLFGTPLSAQFCFGAVLILASVYWFSNPLPASCNNAMMMMQHKMSTPSGNKKSETETMLPR